MDPPDHWELLLGNIVFGEALGEGAFGKVYCATVSGITLQNTFGSSESLDSYVKMGPNRAATPTGSFITMKAAVKLLQGMYLIAVVFIRGQNTPRCQRIGKFSKRSVFKRENTCLIF